MPALAANPIKLMVNGRALVPVKLGGQALGAQPFLPYPTEEQLLARPAVGMDLDGVTSRSYGDGMMLTWSTGNWEYTALGHAPGEGIRVAREILQALPGDDHPVRGASQGSNRLPGGEDRNACLENDIGLVAGSILDGVAVAGRAFGSAGRPGPLWGSASGRFLPHSGRGGSGTGKL
ncbi:MAG: hypothetical protein H5U00_06140 [Clostridia bacterium]|nr:hypothetical protein [Clostridia bacterium]